MYLLLQQTPSMSGLPIYSRTCPLRFRYIRHYSAMSATVPLSPPLLRLVNNRSAMSTTVLLYLLPFRCVSHRSAITIFYPLHFGWSYFQWAPALRKVSFPSPSLVTISQNATSSRPTIYNKSQSTPARLVDIAPSSGLLQELLTSERFLLEAVTLCRQGRLIHSKTLSLGEKLTLQLQFFSEFGLLFT